MAIVTFTEFKGNAMITLARDENDKYPYSFGMSKAKLILECLPEIQAWVKGGSQPAAAPAPATTPAKADDDIPF